MEFLAMMLNAAFKEAQREFKEKGSEEDSVAAYRLYGRMECIHDIIGGINQDYCQHYRVPRLPYSQDR